jgi:hypothetical protein
MIEWDAGADAFRKALDTLVDMIQQFDSLSRFRLAASDMRLVAHAAHALEDAHDRGLEKRGARCSPSRGHTCQPQSSRLFRSSHNG